MGDRQAQKTQMELDKCQWVIERRNGVGHQSELRNRPPATKQRVYFLWAIF